MSRKSALTWSFVDKSASDTVRKERGPTAYSNIWTSMAPSTGESAEAAPGTVRQSRMEIVLDALRKLDDGLIEKVGPNRPGGATQGGSGHGCGKGLYLPFVKGPLVDYMYIIDEHKFRDG